VYLLVKIVTFCGPFLLLHRATELPEALPVFPGLPGASIAVKLRKREASAPFFRDLHAVLAAAHASLAQPGLRPLADALLPPTALEMGVPLDADLLMGQCW
jgi:hypothetical protein